MRLLIHLCNKRSLKIEYMWQHIHQDKIIKILDSTKNGCFIVEDYGWSRKNNLFENKIISKKKSE